MAILDFATAARFRLVSGLGADSPVFAAFPDGLLDVRRVRAGNARDA
jgi:hypothetical protein